MRKRTGIYCYRMWETAVRDLMASAGQCQHYPESHLLRRKEVTRDLTQ